MSFFVAASLLADDARDRERARQQARRFDAATARFGRERNAPRAGALHFEETPDGQPLVVTVAATDADHAAAVTRTVNQGPHLKYWDTVKRGDGALEYQAHPDLYHSHAPAPHRTLGQVLRGENREPAWDRTMFTDEGNHLTLRPGIDERFAGDATSLLIGHAKVKWGDFYGTVRGPRSELERFREVAEGRGLRVYDMDRELDRREADRHFREVWRGGDYDRRPEWSRPREITRPRDIAGAERDL